MKDLDSRLAELFGWKPLTGVDEGYWKKPDGGGIVKPRFTTDWSATGPLIEKYCLSLEFDENNREWGAYAPGEDWQYEQSPLIAACRAIIAMEEK